MATKTRTKKAPALVLDSDGNPDIYVLVTDEEMGIKAAADKAGVTLAEAHRLLYAQEVEHDPENLDLSGLKGQKLHKAIVKQRDEGVRWERLMARTGLSRAQLMTIVAEAKGVELEDVKRQRKAADTEEETTTTVKRASRKGKASKAAAVEEADDEDLDDEVEDDEVEDEAPAPKAKAKRPRRKAA